MGRITSLVGHTVQCNVNVKHEQTPVGNLLAFSELAGEAIAGLQLTVALCSQPQQQPAFCIHDRAQLGRLLLPGLHAII